MDITVTKENKDREKVGICILPPLQKPTADTDICVFANMRPYVPFHETQQMLKVCASYARNNNVYVVPERFAVNDYLCLCMLGPDGEPLGIEKSCHLSLSDRGTFLRDFETEPLKTPFGKIALLPSVDMNIPYLLQEAVLKGAELIISSLYTEPYDISSKRASFYALNAASLTNLPVCASIGGGGIIIDKDKTISAPFASDTCVYGKIEVSNENVNYEEIRRGLKLLNSHKVLFKNTLRGTN